MATTIKCRAKERDGGAEIRLLITHPMKTEGRDAKTGAVVPPHFIQQVTVEVNGAPALDAAWGQAVSTNPYLEVFVNGAKKGDTIVCSWVDNTGTTDKADFKVA